MTEEKTMDKRGGARPGAGRPKGTTKKVSRARPMQYFRAFENEWEVIKALAILYRDGDEKTKRCIEQFIEKYKKE